jgi:hypothetical protein
MDILKERPEGMDFTEYKTHLKFQKAWIKNHKQGRLFYLASEIIYMPEDTKKMFGFRQTYPAFIGKTKELKYPI